MEYIHDALEEGAAAAGVGMYMSSSSERAASATRKFAFDMLATLMNSNLARIATLKYGEDRDHAMLDVVIKQFFEYSMVMFGGPGGEKALHVSNKS